MRLALPGVGRRRPPPSSQPAVPLEVLRKVRRIEIRVRRLLNTAFLGGYHSVFRGQGIEFSEVREYYPGDDMRAIDWNVTARLGYPFVKEFVEERELTVMLLVDVSASGGYGSTGRSKREVAAEVGALLAFSAIRNNDKVGLVAFSDRVEKFVPPRKGREHVLRVIRELLWLQPQGRGTNIAAAINYVNHVLLRRSVVFLLSDFLDAGYESSLRAAGRRHDIIAVAITDPREQALPAGGLVTLEDAETGRHVTIDAGDPAAREAYHRLAEEAAGKRDRLLQSVKVDRVDVHTDRSYVEPLVRFFKTRARRP